MSAHGGVGDAPRSWDEERAEAMHSTRALFFVLVAIAGAFVAGVVAVVLAVVR